MINGWAFLWTIFVNHSESLIYFEVDFNIKKPAIFRQPAFKPTNYKRITFVSVRLAF